MLQRIQIDRRKQATLCDCDCTTDLTNAHINSFVPPELTAKGFQAAAGNNLVRFRDSVRFAVRIF